jgi:hypothetical protein
MLLQSLISLEHFIWEPYFVFVFLHYCPSRYTDWAITARDLFPYFKKLSQPTGCTASNVTFVMNDQLWKAWNEVLATFLKYQPIIYWEELRKSSVGITDHLTDNFNSAPHKFISHTQDYMFLALPTVAMQLVSWNSLKDEYLCFERKTGGCKQTLVKVIQMKGRVNTVHWLL